MRELDISKYSEDLRAKLLGPEADPAEWPVADIIPGDERVFAVRGSGDIDGKLALLWDEFRTEPIIGWIHAALTVYIRRRIDPQRSAARFFTLWDLHRETLLRELDTRWLVSACDTIIDISEDATQRALALNASMFVNTMKLYESERLSNGLDAPTYPIRTDYVPLMDGMTMFFAGTGDMIFNLRQRMLDVASDGSLAADILRELVARAFRHDTVFRRLAAIHTDERSRWAFRAKTVAVFNDTATSGHFGCRAVMEVLDRLVTQSNARIAYRHPVGDDWRADPAALAAIESADVVIVNGEGSIHHANARARALAALGPYCAARGKPVYLVNTTLHANDAALMEDIRAFTRVYVRESASARVLSPLGIRHDICPDLSFLAEFGPRPKERSGLLLIDSVVPPVMQRLCALAAGHGVPLATMTGAPERNTILGVTPEVGSRPPESREALTTVLANAADPAAFARYMGGFNRVVTGRFHAMCFAIRQRIQFHAVPSNTPKIEAVIADIGLDPARVVDLAAGMPPRMPFNADETAAIGRYLAGAERAAKDMAGRIFA